MAKSRGFVVLISVGSMTCARNGKGWIRKPNSSAVWAFRGRGEARRALTGHGYIVTKHLHKED